MPDPGELTPRQREVQALREAGLEPRQIAKALDVSTSAVYAIFRRIDQGADAPTWAHGGARARRAKAGAA